MENKKKAKFNVVDVIILVIIMVAIAISGVKMADKLGISNLGENGTENGTDVSKTKSNMYKISFLCEEVPDFAAEIIKKGDEVICEMSDNSLGFVKKVNITPSRTYVTNAEGEVVLTSKPYYNCVEIEAEVKADEYEHGIMVKRAKYGVGHSITIRVGKSKIFGRISGIEKID